MGRQKKEVKNKRIVGYIPPRYYNKIQKMIDSRDYTSESDIVTQAITEFVEKYEEEKRYYLLRRYSKYDSSFKNIIRAVEDTIVERELKKLEKKKKKKS